MSELSDMQHLLCVADDELDAISEILFGAHNRPRERGKIAEAVASLWDAQGGNKQMNDDIKKRIDNNFQYHAPKEDQPARYVMIRDTGKSLATVIAELCPASREQSLALTKLEEVVMWANAAIARNE